MARTRFSVGEALGAPFRLAAQRPVTVWVWGLIIVLPVLVQGGWLLVAGLDLPFDRFAEAADQDDQEAIRDMILPLIIQLQLGDVLGLALRLVGGAAVGAAIYRAVLKPGEARRLPFALKLGMAEVQVGVTYVMVIIAVTMTFVLAAVIAGGLAMAIIGLLPEAAKFLLLFVPIFLLFLVFIGVYSRLSLIPPSCIADDDFALESGWRRGTGNSGRLALLTLAAMILGMVIVLIAYGLVLTAGWALWVGLDLGSGWPSSFANLRAVLMHDPRILWLAAGLILPIIWVYGLVTVLGLAPYASAVRQLSAQSGADPAAGRTIET